MNPDLRNNHDVYSLTQWYTLSLHLLLPRRCRLGDLLGPPKVCCQSGSRPFIRLRLCLALRAHLIRKMMPLVLFAPHLMHNAVFVMCPRGLGLLTSTLRFSGAMVERRRFTFVGCFLFILFFCLTLLDHFLTHFHRRLRRLGWTLCFAHTRIAF